MLIQTHEDASLNQDPRQYVQLFTAYVLCKKVLKPFHTRDMRVLPFKIS